MLREDTAEGIGAIEALVTAAQHATKQAERLLNKIAELQDENKHLDESLTKVNGELNTMTAAHATSTATVASLREKVKLLEHMVNVLTPAANRYTKLRQCKGKQLPVTADGVLLGGEMLDQALDRVQL